MKLLVISDAPILKTALGYEAYAPYVREMNLWMAHVQNTRFVSPTKYRRSLLTTPFKDQTLTIAGVRRLEFHTLISALISVALLPWQFFVLLREMRRADHIHLRAPGNLTLLACIALVFFPKTPKSAKYAGNWDPKAKQPLSYRLQKKLVSYPGWAKHMTVLVYGKWPDQSKNITSFFTATYQRAEATIIPAKTFEQPLKAIFVGTLSPNKRPFETLQLIHQLRRRGLHIELDLYGEGAERPVLEAYIKEHSLGSVCRLHGNQSAAVVREAYQKSHVVILLSQSEGWPKAIAEGMFWGAVPIATAVSAVPWMLDKGQRGIIIEKVTQIDVDALYFDLSQPKLLKSWSERASAWSRQYTLDDFDAQIKALLG